MVGQIAALNVAIDDDDLLPAFLAGNEALVNCVGILQERGRRPSSWCTMSARPGWPGSRARPGSSALSISRRSAPIRARRSAYARTKAAGEQAVRDAFPTATILRPSIVFGPEDQFFNRFAAMAMVLPILPLIGGGATRFQPVYVGDVAEAAVRCLDDPTTAGRTYELGGPKIYTFRELFELLLGEIRRKRLLVDLPFGLATLQARLLSILPNPPLTADQVELLKQDNIVSAEAMTLASLGIAPTAVEAILPTYLDRFRRGGWYERRA